MIIDLNKKFNLKLQYHGRFKSFLIGFGINKLKHHQPNFKLLRVETNLENTHNKNETVFLGEQKIKGPHFHWYNHFYDIFISHQTDPIIKPSEIYYKQLIQEWLKNNKKLKFNSELIREAVPYDQFFNLWDLVINKNMLFREDSYITTNRKLKKDSQKVLNQILNRDLF